ncbi:6,7-dimethyl-8-ribityllumazine synthase [Mycena olivaceomarginata]|nr:6,7-dimethyl-8-ribityllumazine synthase [Mycena olivaceomarginata]
MSHTIKGLPESAVKHDGSVLRVAIVHARWNTAVIDALVAGAVAKLKERGVKDSNIVVQSVPGSFELPPGVPEGHCGRTRPSGLERPRTCSGGSALEAQAGARVQGRRRQRGVVTMPNEPFDAVIAVGVLIKGSTMHFEYISDAVSHALMRVQLDTGVPVIFGVLTALTDEQALERAGLTPTGHNHGEDWGLAAVEMGAHVRKWREGRFT